jgi:hypothetical protein
MTNVQKRISQRQRKSRVQAWGKGSVAGYDVSQFDEKFHRERRCVQKYFRLYDKGEIPTAKNLALELRDKINDRCSLRHF